MWGEKAGNAVEAWSKPTHAFNQDARAGASKITGRARRPSNCEAAKQGGAHAGMRATEAPDECAAHSGWTREQEDCAGTNTKGRQNGGTATGKQFVGAARQ